MYGYICSNCGAHLDPGESCDCQEENEQFEKREEKPSWEFTNVLKIENNGQMRIVF